MTKLNQAAGKIAFDAVQAKQSAIAAGYDVVAGDVGDGYNKLLSKATRNWTMKR